MHKVIEMNTTAQTNFNNRTLTVEDVLLAVERLKAIPQNDKWLIVDPQGNMVIGKYMEVAHFFLQRHPMLELPTTSVPFDWTKESP